MTTTQAPATLTITLDGQQVTAPQGATILEAAKAAHRAAGERKVRVRHDALGIEESAHAKPVTIRARAGRTIERE